MAEKQGSRLYVQVAYLLFDETVRAREFRPFHLINDNHPKLILTMDSGPDSDIDGIARRFLPDWLLG